MSSESTDYIAIFSSTEASDVARRVQDALAEAGLVARHWSDLAPASRTIFDSVTSAVKAASAAVLVFTPDTRKDPEGRAVFGNLLFELGLSVGHLGMDRTFILW